jgi:hypothetical protein
MAAGGGARDLGDGAGAAAAAAVAAAATAAATAEVHVLRDLLAESLRLCRDALGPRPGGAAGEAAVAATRRQLEEMVAAGAGLLGGI